MELAFFSVDPDMASMIDEEESSLSTRGVINPTAEERRKKDQGPKSDSVGGNQEH